jgi:uncharacterized protein YneF (UPF0154 family)
MGAFRVILIVILALLVGFAGGYYWEMQKVRDLEGQIKGLMVEMENSSRASREQLAKAEAQKEIYKLKALITEARSDVTERNFGRADERMDAVEGSLEKAFAPLGDKGIEVRDNLKMSLEGVREGIKKLDVKVKVKIEELSKILDPVLEK